jgi:CRISPR-associated endonuclease/helicase Cas3
VADDCPYPRLLSVSAGRSSVVHVPASPERHAQVALRWQDAAGLADGLRRALAGGGCAVVIRNTVVAAQETYLALRDLLRADGIEVGLFHARFLLGRRLEIEGDVLGRYGLPTDNPRRPRAAVLLSTQVVEQSLDLDFDLLVTDVAPVDLVLQRAGRLHRHRGRTRPPSLASPQVWLLRPECDPAGVPAFGRDEFIYERHVLLRSYLALAGRSSVRIPADVEGLIEQVYGDDPADGPDEAWRAALAASRDRMEERRAKSEGVAAQLAIKPPDYEGDLLRDFNRELEEDAPELHPTLQALTRLSPPNVTLICLYRTPSGLRTGPDAPGVVDVRHKPNLDEVRGLLRCSVNVSHHGLVRHFQGRPAPSGWRDNALVRHHRLAELDGAGTLVADGHMVRLDPELGMVIGKAGEQGREEP